MYHLGSNLLSPWLNGNRYDYLNYMRPGNIWPPSQGTFNSDYYPYTWYSNTIQPGIGAWSQIGRPPYQNYPSPLLPPGLLSTNYVGGYGYGGNYGIGHGYGNGYGSSGYGNYNSNGALRQFLGYWYPDYLGQRNRENSYYGNNDYYGLSTRISQPSNRYGTSNRDQNVYSYN